MSDLERSAYLKMLQALEVLIDEYERKCVPYGVDGLPECWNQLVTAAEKGRAAL